MKTQQIQKMTVSAVMLGMAFALGLVTIWVMPMGGSITLLSMLPIAFISVTYGTGWGLTVAFVYSLLQLATGISDVLSWGLTTQALVGTIVFDYLIAFTVLGLAGMFRKKGTVGIMAGVFIAVGLRFVSHFFSGVVIFGSLVNIEEIGASIIYSLTYNGTYMLPEAIFTMIGAAAVFQVPQMKKMMGLDTVKA